MTHSSLENEALKQQTNEQSIFLEQCEAVHCANEIALSNQYYNLYAPLPQANKILLTEINQKIEREHDWFFDILQQYRLRSVLQTMPLLLMPVLIFI